jgi:glycine cleavage system aminomethyltransferase T
MENLGHPKRILTGLRLESGELPIAGTQVFDADDRHKVIGAVTSSTISPLRGNAAIGFAMIKWGKHQPDTRVAVAGEGQLVEATITALSDNTSQD